MGEERHIAGALLNYGSGGSFRELGLMIWRVMQANNSSKFAVATVPVGQHSRTTFCPGKMNSAFWKERSSGRDTLTIKPFADLYTALFTACILAAWSGTAWILVFLLFRR